MSSEMILLIFLFKLNYV